MSQVLTVPVLDEVLEHLRRAAEQQKRTPEEVAADWIAATARSLDDPVLRLLGTVESDITDISERHDYYLGQSLMPARGKNA